MTTETQHRTPSAIDAVAEQHTERLIEMSPALRVELGRPGDETVLDDYSPAGAAARDALNARTLAALDEAEAAMAADGTAPDAVDAVTLDAMRERLGVERDLHAAGLDIGQLNVIASPLQEVRELFDLVPTETTADWEHSAAKLRAVDTALAGYRESLLAARDAGRAPARRQVERGIEQAREAAKAGGHFDRFVAKATAVPEALAAELAESAKTARTAYVELAEFLAEEIAPHAREEDACGREDYRLLSRAFLGTEVDLDETYAWGLAELERIDAEQRRIAERIAPGTDVLAVMHDLDADPAQQLHGLDALRSWMQEKADAAITALGGSAFDIPEPVRTIECMVLADGTGGIYYTPPTDDFSRPGRMWWSVPAGVETFSTWQELTTVYHEGVPGHHLQIGQAVVVKDTLNTWRRQICWVSGHGEGWALYAEKLMAELGFLDDPADRLGMLDSQRVRAARVCVDIGVHCGLEAPESVGGGIWDADKAWEFLTANVAMDRSFLAFELDRYLGWPGQAPSYAIGRRLWEQAREEARAAAEADGRAFDLKAFHSRALDLGSVGLDTLRRALA